MKRINNFHKSKPIVQNVKTDSVNEGKAPKNLTLANDISDWNPGVAHEQISEADAATANTFEEAIGGKDQKSQAGGAAAPTSYSEAVNQFLVIRGSQARYRENAQRWTEAKEKYLSNTEELDVLQRNQTELQDEYDSYNAEIADLQKMMNDASAKGDDKMVAKVSTKMNSVVDRNQEMVTKYNGVSAQINTVEANLAQANVDLDDAVATGRNAAATLKAYGGELPDVEVDMRDPRDQNSKEPIKGDPIPAPIKGEPGEALPPPNFLDPGLQNPIKGEPGQNFNGIPSYGDSIPTKTIQQALANAEPARREQEAVLQNPEEELLPRDAKAVVREFQPEDDMHEAVKAGGMGLDLIADGGRVEKEQLTTHWHFHLCGTNALEYYTTVNLDAAGFPSVFEDSGGNTYVRDGVSSGAPLLGTIDGAVRIAASVDGSGNYNGAFGITCIE